MKAYLILLFPFYLLMLQSCENDNTIIKQIKIDIIPSSSIHYVTWSVKGKTFENMTLYKDFNKNNYKNCESIIFVGHIGIHESSDSCTCYLELYNYTDSVSISNSLLSTRTNKPVSSINPIYVWKESGDIKDYCPDKNIDLTARLKSSREGSSVQVNSASLYINF